MEDDWEPIETLRHRKAPGFVVEARQGKCAVYHLIFVHGNWTPLEFNGSHHPTHWREKKETLQARA